MYGDPLFINAEIAYRRELFTTSTGRHAGPRHGHRLADRLHVKRVLPGNKRVLRKISRVGARDESVHLGQVLAIG